MSDALTAMLERLIGHAPLSITRAGEHDKLTRTFPKNARMSYRYFDAGRNGKNQQVHFCWSTERNAAGFFLSWRETIRAHGKAGKRDKWAARRKRNAAKALAQRRCNAVKAKRSTV